MYLEKFEKAIIACN